MTLHKLPNTEDHLKVKKANFNHVCFAVQATSDTYSLLFQVVLLPLNKDTFRARLHKLKALLKIMFGGEYFERHNLKYKSYYRRHDQGSYSFISERFKLFSSTFRIRKPNISRR